ncbi:hypothetical protein D9M72_399990 [compost metagenome]
MRDAVLLHQLQVVLGIEMLHHYRGPAQRLHGHVVAQRRRVVQRRRRQVARLGIEAIEPLAQAGQGRGIFDTRARRRRIHPLRPTRGAGRIQHVATGHFVIDARCRAARQRGLVRVIAWHGAIQHQPATQCRRLPGQGCRDLGLRVRGDQQLGAAVIDDVGGIGHVQPRAQADIDNAAALRAPAQFEQARMILDHERHAVTGLQSLAAEQVGDLVRAFVQFAVGNDCAAAAHDDGWFVGRALRVDVRMHGVELLDGCRCVGGCRSRILGTSAGSTIVGSDEATPPPFCRSAAKKGFGCTRDSFVRCDDAPPGGLA